MNLRKSFLLFSSLMLVGCVNHNPVLSSSPIQSSTEETKDETKDYEIKDFFFQLNSNNELCLHVKGQFSPYYVIHSLSFVIDNTQDNTIDRSTLPVAYDSTHGFEFIFPLSSLEKERAWYNLYFLINGNEKFELQVQDISNKQFHAQFDYEISTTEIYSFYFENWEGNLKLVFLKKDSLSTTYYSLSYQIETIEDQEYLYVHLKGNSQHKNLKMILDGNNRKETTTILLDEKGNFDAFLRVDDILVEKNQYRILMEYELQSGSLFQEEINDYNLANSASLQGICYRLNLYVFKATKTGKKIYYRLCNCPDNFSMDYVGLYLSSGVKLKFSGTVRLFPSGLYSLHIKGIDKGQDYVYLIYPNFVSSTGYLEATLDLSQMPLFNSYQKESTIGQLELFHDTLRLNQFWANEWSHRKDDLGPVEDKTYRYQILSNSDDGTYYLTKEEK